VLSEVTRTSELSIKSFTVYPVSKHGKVASARIYSAGLAYNNLSLNGTRTSDRYLDPPFTNYYDTAYYRTEDVTKLLRQEPGAAGENVIATQLGSGHFDQESVTVNWAYETSEWRQTPRFRMDMYIQYADGTEQVVQSDGTWKVSTGGPTRYDDYYLGETYDARQEIPNWDKSGFDASSWPAAQVVEAPKGQMRASRRTSTPNGGMTKRDSTVRTQPRCSSKAWRCCRWRSGWSPTKSARTSQRSWWRTW
jgi:alpha-L-rhamnosidase